MRGLHPQSRPLLRHPNIWGSKVLCEISDVVRNVLVKCCIRNWGNYWRDWQQRYNEVNHSHLQPMHSLHHPRMTVVANKLNEYGIGTQRILWCFICQILDHRWFIWFPETLYGPAISQLCEFQKSITRAIKWVAVNWSGPLGPWSFPHITILLTHNTNRVYLNWNQESSKYVESLGVGLWIT